MLMKDFEEIISAECWSPDSSQRPQAFFDCSISLAKWHKQLKLMLLTHHFVTNSSRHHCSSRKASLSSNNWKTRMKLLRVAQQRPPSSKRTSQRFFSLKLHVWKVFHETNKRKKPDVNCNTENYFAIKAMTACLNKTCSFKRCFRIQIGKLWTFPHSSLHSCRATAEITISDRRAHIESWFKESEIN